MDYYDGNTVTGLWNYAQNYAMSDHSFGTNFGPSTPGAINLVSGQTHGFIEVDSDDGRRSDRRRTRHRPRPGPGVGTMIDDPDPAVDDCSDSTGVNHAWQATGTNIGDLLNAKGITWGWFQGGFGPTTPSSGGSATPVLRRHAHQHRRQLGRRLQPAPQPVRVLRVDGQPAPPAADLDQGDRQDRPGQPRLRPVRLRPRRSRPRACPPSASSRRPSTRTATAGTRTRSTSSTSSSTRST